MSAGQKLGHQHSLRKYNHYISYSTARPPEAGPAWTDGGLVAGCEEGLVRAEEEIEGGPLGGDVLGVADGAVRGVLDGAVALDVTDGAV